MKPHPAETAEFVEPPVVEHGHSCLCADGDLVAVGSHEPNQRLAPRSRSKTQGLYPRLPSAKPQQPAQTGMSVLHYAAEAPNFPTPSP